MIDPPVEQKIELREESAFRRPDADTRNAWEDTCPEAAARAAAEERAAQAEARLRELTEELERRRDL